MHRNLKHGLHVVAMYSIIIGFGYGSFCQKQDCQPNAEQADKYGIVVSVIFTAVQLLIFLPLPQIISNVLGLTFFNAFPGKIEVVNPSANQDSDSMAGKIPTIPHLCFRVVTRGMYPELVQQNIHKNYLTCSEMNLQDFSIEVVTDKDIYLSDSDPRIRQIIVPLNYTSSTGALFKARALQYALEPEISPLQPGDYIVHLDEETILSRNVINGIINFALEGKHAFGQGLITYTNQEIVNLLTTLADSYRVADDMGKLRFQLAAFHKPLFGWKGSFVVTKCEAEKDVSFDHGIDGSIAEDCYFSMVAFSKGYSFDFIQGEMFEKSPFSIMDLIRQRKRWVQGIWLVVHSTKIPFRVKFFLTMSHYAWLTMPISSLCYILAMIFPLATPSWQAPLGTFCFAVTLYMYIFGLLKSFDLKQRSIGVLIVYLMVQIFTLSVNVIIESVAVLWGLFTPKHNFYIVQKDVNRKVLLDA